MEQQTEIVVTEFVNAVKNLNMEKLGSLLHPSVKWNQPGANRFSGLKQSSNEVFEMVGGMFEISRNTLSLAAIQTIAINGNQASVLLRWTAGRPGDGLDVENVDVYTVKDGKIVEVTVYSADLKHENAFWGK